MSLFCSKYSSGFLSSLSNKKTKSLYWPAKLGMTRPSLPFWSHCLFFSLFHCFPAKLASMLFPIHGSTSGHLHLLFPLLGQFPLSCMACFFNFFIASMSLNDIFPSYFKNCTLSPQCTLSTALSGFLYCIYQYLIYYIFYFLENFVSFTHNPNAGRNIVLVHCCPSVRLMWDKLYLGRRVVGNVFRLSGLQNLLGNIDSRAPSQREHREYCIPCEGVWILFPKPLKKVTHTTCALIKNISMVDWMKFWKKRPLGTVVVVQTRDFKT